MGFIGAILSGFIMCNDAKANVAGAAGGATTAGESNEAAIVGGNVLIGAIRGIVTGGYGANVAGAMVAGATVAGATVAGATVAGAMVAGAMVAGAMVAGATL